MIESSRITLFSLLTTSLHPATALMAFTLARQRASFISKLIRTSQPLSNAMSAAFACGPTLASDVDKADYHMPRQPLLRIPNAIPPTCIVFQHSSLIVCKSM
eukprot:364352-Chlamydomonas_euryale.AAC.6